MNKEELLIEAKKSANVLKDFFVNELQLHRNSGNFKYEITPKDICNAYMKGVEYVLQKFNIE